MNENQSQKISCKVCGFEFETDKQLHVHVKIHKLLLIEYYQQYYPRYDLLEGKIIKFKNKDQYFNTDFNSRENLKKWIETIPKERAIEYCKNFLKKRKEIKGLIYTPTQVELRSVMIPSVFVLNNLFGDYYKTCEDLGFKNKYIYPHKQIQYDLDSLKKHKIYIDTREQKPLDFNNEVEIKTLKFGDYALSNEEYTCKCHIERKSLNDFSSTLSGGYERFCREIERAEKFESYLIVLIEESLENCLRFNSLPSFFKKNARANPDYVFHNVRAIIQKYPFVQFLFVKNRKTASEVMEKLFSCNCEYKNIDLQLAYDLKLL